MSRQLVITYYADRDMLGLVSDEDYEAFKDILLEQLHKEWPKAAINVDDGAVTKRNQVIDGQARAPLVGHPDDIDTVT